MRTEIKVAGILLAAALTAPLAGRSAEVDGIAARVDSETILKSDVCEEMRRQNADSSRFNEVRNEMIDRKLILRAAGEAKMTLQEWVVDNNIRDIIARNFGGDRNKLMDTLARQKVSYPEWRTRMKEDMIISAMRWNVVDKNVTASPAAVRREYAEHPERYAEGAKVTVSVILLKPEDKGLRDEVAAALADKPFGDVARRYSADSRAADGGVWKDVNPADVFRKEVCEELGQMPKGTVSHWIEIDGWSFLLRKDAATDGRTIPFEEAYDRIVETIKEAEAKRVYEAWIERLRAETYIKVF